MPLTTPKRLAPPNDPVRQCVGCRTRAPKRTLLRFVAVAQGGWEPDPRARRDGRGVYLCSPQCVERVKKNKRYKSLATAAVPSAAWPAH
ncbi:MAG: YlxR family protein [Candidatus Eremiobacteraeota bacterium]|nr:YlxR family protein [Candidatus Eremiobacteraeota bacterium]MBV8223533.1 YlxR family protein [Candidatus Eremiobacteraeota bacterium]MBV8281764.1 YlxR family protein [Candidatus Eremiobacteraeota bacterium]